MLIYSAYNPACSAGQCICCTWDFMGNLTCASGNTMQPNDNDCIVTFCIGMSMSLTCFSWWEGKAGRKKGWEDHAVLSFWGLICIGPCLVNQVNMYR